jgi:hypothetical protein
MGSAEFFDPLTKTSPSRAAPPVTSSLCMSFGLRFGQDFCVLPIRVPIKQSLGRLQKQSGRGGRGRG